jgi:pyrimidine deaminase RibD-like protein
MLARETSMSDTDFKWMREAITWAEGCVPNTESIPKVGAIIAVDGEALGRGRRGTGNEGDDKHAEFDALLQVSDKSRLPQATLYTTLEPCTPEVRTNELECCTELILQYKIPRVFIGILDPNQGVTGKGLLRLQDNNVEVNLFPHGLAQRIRAINTAFIRSQRTLGARIIRPTQGTILKTYDTLNKHPVQFKCLNPPVANNFLFSFHNGLCWPQPGPFRQVGAKLWEIDAHFGATGDYILHLVTATDLGQALVEYYRRVVILNMERRKNVIGKLAVDDVKLLGDDYPGIQMIGPLKGFRSEAFVGVTIAEMPR